MSDTVVIGTDPTQAFEQLERIEKALRNLGKGRGIDRSGPKGSPSASGEKTANYTARIAEGIAIAVEHSTRLLAFDLLDATPRWSSWMAANWNHEQGSYPDITPIPTPNRDKGYYVEFVGPIIGNVDLDGYKPQYIYNSAQYSGYVAEGEFPAESAPADWYLAIEQYHRGGGYIKSGITFAKREVGE